MTQEPVPAHFIVDPSALVFGGIGRIKQWVRDKENRRPAVLYIPRYTLLELDFLKKSFNPVIARNARESVRYIDAALEDDDGLGSDSDSLSDFSDFESYNRKKQERKEEKGKTRSRVCTQFVLESPEDEGPVWKVASGYRRRTPRKSEFPTYTAGEVGVFGRSSLGMYGKRATNAETEEDGIINSSLKETQFQEMVRKKQIPLAEAIKKVESASEEDDEKAVVPKRLKLLIRSAIQKQIIDNKNRAAGDKIEWVVLCEDETTARWLKCFNLAVTTLNSAESLLEKGRTSVNGVEKEEAEVRERTPVQEEKTETLEAPKKHKSRRRAGRSPRSPGSPRSPNARSTRHLCEDGVYRESFKETKYAPRGKGELWTP